ncbi:M48 family metalloprotease [Candidatus Uhrbacteria bacterium]|nr:M48 family metalloprotease [Candidatus Uhrbacteria bacterium]
MRHRTNTLLAAAMTLGSGCGGSTKYILVRVNNDAALQYRVHGLGEHLTRTACSVYDCTGIEWRFGVVEDHPFGASASYDGNIAVDAWLAGTLRIDELAWLVSHEIGHAIKHHARRGTTADVAGSGAVLIGTLVTLPFAPWWVPLSVLIGGDTTRELGTAAYGRSLEVEADTFAVWLTVAAGYPPDSGIRALARMGTLAAHRQPWFGATLFATHPELTDRIVNVAREAARYRR